MAVLFCLSSSGCPVLAVLSWLSCPGRVQKHEHEIYERENQGAHKYEREFKEREKSRSAKAQMQKREI
jgi:hypothetical protein